VTGFARVIPTGPVTTSELLYSLNYIKKHGPHLSSTAQNLYNSIEQKLQKNSKIIIEDEAAIDLSLIYSFETYIHTNEDDVQEESLWSPRWKERLPIVSLPIDMSLFNIFSSSVEFVALRRLADYPDKSIYSSLFSTNHSLRDFFTLDLYWPYRAVAAVGGKQWSIQFGRDTLQMGPGYTGNLLISNHLKYHEYGQFKTWFGPLSFTSQYIGFPSPKDLGEGDDRIKMLLNHRLDWNIFPMLRISITEAMMYQDEVVDFRFMNPLMIYHQYFMPSRSNSMLTGELIISPLPGISIYGQLALDDVRFLDESDSIPNALGWIIGAEYAWLTSSSTYHMWIEHVHTDPYLYQRDGINFIVSTKHGSSYTKHYVGYPLGGDAHVYAMGLKWSNTSNFDAMATLEFSRKGEVPFEVTNFPPPEPNLTTPTGIHEDRMRASIKGTYNIDTFTWGQILCNAQISYLYIHNHNHQLGDSLADLQCSFAVSYIL
jgi:hypothetical protein